MSTDQEAYKNHILDLIAKLKNGQATEAEVQEIDYWYDHPTSTKKYADGMSNLEKVRAKDKMFQNINDRVSVEPISIKRYSSYSLIQIISIAASVLMVVGAGLYYSVRSTNQHPAQSVLAKADFSSNNKAVLTLANGKKIVLTGAKNGILATDGDAVIHKTAEGDVIYDANLSPNNIPDYNTMATLRGGEYHLTLSDGTNVWLNAASSIKYPTVFTGKQRDVEITGEAYFEVAHNTAMPFRVITKNQVIEVLGTHFNVNAYANEVSTKTTLLQGAVKVTADGRFKLLKPGQQASLTGNDIKIANVEIQEAVAWRDGFFEFTDADIETIMRQVSRWYDVDVVYEGRIPKETFSGRISKSINLNQLITMIQSPKVHIKYKEGRVMVRE